VCGAEPRPAWTRQTFVDAPGSIAAFGEQRRPPSPFPASMTFNSTSDKIALLQTRE